MKILGIRVPQLIVAFVVSAIVTAVVLGGAAYIIRSALQG